MNCVLIEDDYNTQQIITQIIQENFPNISIQGSASSIKNGVQLIKETDPDFIFLDVNLDDGEGFQILQSFPTPSFKIIFITSYSKYAIEAFKFSALDFVLKPFIPSDIVKAVNKVIQNQQHHNHLDKISTLYHNHIYNSKKIVLSNADHIHVVAIEDILYAASDNSYTTFHLVSGEKILVSKSLKSFEEKLSPYLFFRIHQRYLINLKYLEKFQKKNDKVVLAKQFSLEVSKNKKEALLSFLKDL